MGGGCDNQEAGGWGADVRPASSAQLPVPARVSAQPADISHRLHPLYFPPLQDGGLPSAGSKAGGWVPPSLRNRIGGEGGPGGEMMNKRRDENSVRVSNLSEDVTEDDLAELFGPFGPIQRIFVAKDRETGGWGLG